MNSLGGTVSAFKVFTVDFDRYMSNECLILKHERHLHDIVSPIHLNNKKVKRLNRILLCKLDH